MFFERYSQIISSFLTNLLEILFLPTKNDNISSTVKVVKILCN